MPVVPVSIHGIPRHKVPIQIGRESQKEVSEEHAANHPLVIEEISYLAFKSGPGCRIRFIQRPITQVVYIVPFPEVVVPAPGCSYIMDINNRYVAIDNRENPYKTATRLRLAADVDLEPG